MSSRFVPAGTDVSSDSQPDAWAKARQEVQDRREARPVEQGKQENGQSLYEVLQANKAAKQEAFEESTKLRNQFRPLDESEIEFLDSVREQQQSKDDFVKRDTADQLESFKKQRAAAEQAAVSGDASLLISKHDASQDLWRVVKKRRRDKTDDDDSTKKSKQSSDPLVTDQDSTSSLLVVEGEPRTPASHIEGETKSTNVAGRDRRDKNNHVASNLVTYDSEED